MQTCEWLLPDLESWLLLPWFLSSLLCSHCYLLINSNQTCLYMPPPSVCSLSSMLPTIPQLLAVINSNQTCLYTSAIPLSQLHSPCLSPSLAINDGLLAAMHCPHQRSMPCPSPMPQWFLFLLALVSMPQQFPFFGPFHSSLPMPSTMALSQLCTAINNDQCNTHCSASYLSTMTGMLLLPSIHVWVLW